MALFSRISPKSHPHFWLLALIILLAIGLRGFNLSGLPAGLHGDEGIVGYEARRVLREGSIGPYSPASFGQPAGPIYVSALGVAWGGDEILSIRAVSALFGVLTVAALYALTRAGLGASTALLSAFLLAITVWHVHYSRIAFPLIAWPLMCLLIVGALGWARRQYRARWWLIAGLVNGLGIYAYKAHPLFGLIAVALAAWTALRAQTPRAHNSESRASNTGASESRASDTCGLGVRVAGAWRWSWLGLYLVGALLAASVMIGYALDPAHHYGKQFAQTSTFGQPAWLELQSSSQRALFLAGRYWDWWGRMAWRPTVDYSDGAGIVPLLSPVVLGLALLGFVAWKRREPLVNWSRWIVLLMPVAAVVTNDGFARRTFAMAPFLCVLAAVGAVELARALSRLLSRLGSSSAKSSSAKIAPAIVAVVLAAGAFSSWQAYFVAFAKAPQQAWIFCDELTQALYFMRTLPRERPIYFYSSRWSVTYDTRKFLAPGLNARDASAEFAPDRRLLWPPPPENHAVWILMDVYQSRATELTLMFPNARLREGAPSLAAQGKPAFLVLEN